MKKSPHKLPWELHDPPVAPVNCAMDLSEQAPAGPERVLPRPAEPEMPGGKL